MYTSILLLPLLGCAPPPDAPAELSDLGAYLYREFDQPDVLAGGVLALDQQLSALDLDSALNDRAFTMPPLQQADRGDILSPDLPAEHQLPVAIAGLSRHDLDEHMQLVGLANQVCIESDTTTWYGRSIRSGTAECLADGTCTRVDTDNEVRKESFVANVWYDFRKDHQLVQLDDGREAMVARGWIERPFPADNDSYSWDQFFQLDVLVPSPDGGTTRFQAVWSAVQLGPVGPDIYVNTVKNAMDDHRVNADDFIDGSMCANDRDRPYDRPQAD